MIILLHGEASVTDNRRLQRSGQKEILSWSALMNLGKVFTTIKPPTEVFREIISRNYQMENYLSELRELMSIIAL